MRRSGAVAPSQVRGFRAVTIDGRARPIALTRRTCGRGPRRAAAVFRRSPASATALLDHGADMDAGGRSAVEIAAFFGLEEMAELLAARR
jgi:hypothetical protein